MPENTQNPSVPPEEDHSRELEWTIESADRQTHEDPEEFGQTIVSPRRDDATGEPAPPTVVTVFGPTLVSPFQGAGRPLGPGDTVVLTPRAVPQEFGFLVIRAGQRAGDIFKLDQPRNLIGRNRDVHIFVDDAHVSGLHASIRCEKVEGSPRGEFVLRDLDSENGTYVNGQRLSASTVLQDGDVIRVGESDLVFKRV
jgi:hypothetical protein